MFAIASIVFGMAIGSLPFIININADKYNSPLLFLLNYHRNHLIVLIFFTLISGAVIGFMRCREGIIKNKIRDLNKNLSEILQDITL